MTVRVDPVESSRDLHAFVTFPWSLYRSDPAWVPPLIGDTKKLFDREKHPFFAHGDVRPFLARRGKRIVGRIAAVRNRAHEAFHQEPVGFFGFFESENDPEVAAALLQTVRGVLRGEGLERVRGPVNPSTNEDCGILVEGFDTPPMIMMTHNLSYYDALLTGAGLVKAKDLLAYVLTADSVPERLARGAALARRRHPEITVRPFDKKHFGEEVTRFRDVYNAAWEKNWGFVPMTDAELEHMAHGLKPVIDPGLVRIAQHGERTVGFALGLPDLYQATRHANGRLFPLGLIKILWYSRRIRRARIVTLGILESYRRSGIDVMLYHDLFSYGLSHGYTTGEFSWILEDNMAIIRPLEHMGAHPYKRYRLYEGPVA